MNTIRHSQQGFTLMEVLVALFILSIMSVAAVSGLNAVLRAQSQQVGTAHQLQALQLTYTWLVQDLNQFVERPVLNTIGEVLPAFMLGSDAKISQVGIPGQILLVLTRGGIIDPNNLSSLQRVAYTLQNNQLTRYTWGVLDAVPSTVTRQQILLRNVTYVQLRYLSEQGSYYQNWRDYTGKAKTPLAMEWKITNEDGRTITWLLPITGGGIVEEENSGNANNTIQ